jgi:hypothetical protein
MLASGLIAFKKAQKKPRSPPLYRARHLELVSE